MENNLNNRNKYANGNLYKRKRKKKDYSNQYI